MNKATINIGTPIVTHYDMMNVNYQMGIKIITYNPTGWYKIFELGWEKAEQLALQLKNDNVRYRNTIYDAIFTQTNKDRYYRLLEFTQNFNRQNNSNYTIMQMLYAWILKHPRVDALSIQAHNVEELEQINAALELTKQITVQDINNIYNDLDPDTRKNDNAARKCIQWLISKQDQISNAKLTDGLVLSFDNRSDQLANWAVTYDQACAAIAFAVEFKEPVTKNIKQEQQEF